ncbi:MAG: hypothetical protein MUF10_08120 [Thermoanaerobaculaceae bacterium]|nr:hypothetical protein [Thermoanaerobaculaceae bacterium]
MRRCGLMRAGIWSFLIVIVAGVAGCLVPPPPPLPVVVEVVIPADHTKDKHGIRHRPGYKAPEGVCNPCHGRDLRGTDEVRGCYRCHRKNWD